MRDMLVCKHCDFFMENQINPVMRINLEIDSSMSEISTRYFFRRHNCEFECLGTRIGRIANTVEYYNMEAPSKCPYKLEHEMYEMNGEHGHVNYGFSRHFRKTRTCQHCGATIPNAKTCPKCGYDYFEIYKPYNEKAILVNAVILFVLFAILFAWMVAR